MRLAALSFLAGILVFQQLTSLPDSNWALLLLVIIPLAYKLKRIRLFLVFFCGILWALLHANQQLGNILLPEMEGKDVVIEGFISSIPVKREHGIRFRLDVDTLFFGNEAQENAPKTVLLSWYGYTPALSAGDRWRFLVKLKRPHGFMNPGGFDYEAWLFRQGIGATGYIKKSETNALISSDNASYPLQRLRQHLLNRIISATTGSAHQGIISAIAVGERQTMTDEQWHVLTTTGTNHLVAISGLHIGLIAGLLFFLTRYLWSISSYLTLRIPAAKAAAVAAIAGALVYAALAGFSVPTERALIMVVIVMLGVLRQRSVSISHTLSLAMLLVLIFDPLSVMSSGFWLSFCAVAIITIGMNHSLQTKGLWWKWGRIHLLIFVGLTPVLLFFFQQLPLLSPFANFIAVPWVSFIVVPVILSATLIINLAAGVGDTLFTLADLTLSWIWYFMVWLSDLDLGKWTQHSPVAWTLLPAIVGTLLLISPRGLPVRWLGLIWLLPVFLVLPAKPEHGDVWFTLLDVGQGLSAVAQTKDHTLVYDTGPRFSENFDSGEAVVVPFLRQYGITTVDVLMIGHGDSDHMGGAESVNASLDIKRVISSEPEKITWMDSELCHKGESWHWNGVSFEVLHPSPERPYKGNNGSCVLKITNAEGAVLLTGDIEKGAEKYLSGTNNHLAADILVVPHHGSKTSSTERFIDAVGPDYALMPVGYRNRFNFPKPEIAERYQQRDIALFNTAEHGAVIFRLDSDGLVEPPTLYRDIAKRYWHDS
ncbi:MAG: DNA internalization-related competence protein ComEC/Rec2 [Gammaproteobacteria bacterium]